MSKNTINTIIGIVIIFGIIFAYSMWTAPSKEEKAKMKQKQDSAIKAQIAKIKNDSVAMVLQKKTEDSLAAIKKTVIADTTHKGDSIRKVEKVTKLGSFSGSSVGVNKEIVLENKLLKIKVSQKGGFISSVELKKYKTWDQYPLVLFKSDTAFKVNFYGNNNALYKTSDFYFEPFWADKKFEGKDSVAVAGADSLVFAMRLYPNVSDTDTIINRDKYIEFRYVLKDSNYMIGFNINLVNMQSEMANSNLFFEWSEILRQQEKDLKTETHAATIYYKPSDDNVDYLSETKDDEKQFKVPVKWVSFKQQFFSSTIIAKETFKEAEVKVKIADDSISPRYLKTMYAQITVPYTPGSSQSYPMSLYFGPNHYKTMRAYDLDLERQIPLGWSSPYILGWINRFAVIPVFNWLESYGINYGIIILLLTIMLKIVLFPIAYKTYKSSAKMRVLKPEIEEIGKKFPKKEDAMKKQQATMALYKKAGVSPMAGCVPMLLQMPILIALYRFFPASIELRQQSFLWATDLSSYDSIASWNTYIPIISTYYGNHISLFTLLMTITTLIYTWMNNQLMGNTQQMPGMKWMMYLMPVMFLGFFNSFASGLSYYYFLANMFTFLQMFVIRYFIDEEKIHAQIQENKKKTVKKSGFQARLEEMAKKRGYNPSKK
jgi:YidC/Oxa1 family membrane protein insertase